MDIGCGTGSLLETLVIPPSTIYEPPITQKPIQSGGPSSYGSTSGSSQEEFDEEEDVDRELFILVRLLSDDLHFILVSLLLILILIAMRSSHTTSDTRIAMAPILFSLPTLVYIETFSSLSSPLMIREQVA